MAMGQSVHDSGDFDLGVAFMQSRKKSHSLFSAPPLQRTQKTAESLELEWETRAEYIFTRDTQTMKAEAKNHTFASKRSALPANSIEKGVILLEQLTIRF